MKPATVPTVRRLIDDREAAHSMSISRSAFRALVAAGKIPRVQVPSADGGTLRRLLVDQADLDRLIQVWKRRT